MSGLRCGWGPRGVHFCAAWQLDTPACPPAACRIDTPLCSYKHGMLERSGLPSRSQDLVAVQFVIHECPADIISQMVRCVCVRACARVCVCGAWGGAGLHTTLPSVPRGCPCPRAPRPTACTSRVPPRPPQIQEALRLLRPGGLLAFVDINPASSAGRSMPPAIAMLMKATEPWIDEVRAMGVGRGARRQWGVQDGSVDDGSANSVLIDRLDPPSSSHYLQYCFFALEDAMAQAGFKAVATTELDPRHRITLGHL